MVGGGLPVGSSVVLQGPPGQEKLRFALTFLAEGLKSGSSGLVVTSSQSPDAVIAELRNLGVDLDSVTNENRLRIVDWYSWSEETVHDIEERGIVIRSSIDLTNLGVALSRAIAALTGTEPRRAVIELLSPATGSYEVTQVYAFAQSAKRKFDRHQFTSLVLLEKEMHSGTQLTTLHQPFDGAIEIERTRSGDRIIRKVGVLHLKDTAPDPTFRVLEMSEAGMRVVEDMPKPATGPGSTARGSAPESQDERAQRLRLILQIATERLKLNPGDADALFAMAAAQATLDDAKGGLETLDRLAALDSAYPGLWVLKTKLHAKLGQSELAKRSRLRAVQREPEAAKAIDATVPCPMCEAPVAMDATTCANCGVRFTPTRTLEDELDDLGHAAIQEIVQEELAAEPKTESKHPTPPVPKQATKPPAKPSPKRGMTNGLVLQRGASHRAGMTNGLKGRTNGLRGRTNGLMTGRGRTNGLTNGVGRTNGLTNGVGRTNGLTDGLGRTNGLTNGLGRTNGITNGLGRTNGLTNGLGGLRPAGFHSSGVRGMMRNAGWKLYLIPLVVVLLLLVPLFLVPEYQGPTYPIQIDGQFGDWNGVSRLSVTSSAANPDIDITQVAVKDNLDYLSFYIGVRGLALNGGPSPGRVTNAFYAFIDVDRSASTGYGVQGIGADRMVRINTWGGQVVSSALMAFNTSRSPTDWNGWVSIGPVYAAGSTDRIEFETPWLDLAQNPVPVDVAFASRSWDGQSDAADLVATNAEPFLLVRQNTTAPVTVTGSNGTLSTFNFQAVGGDVTLVGLNVSFPGTHSGGSIASVAVQDGTGVVLDRQPIGPKVHFSLSGIPVLGNQSTTLYVRPAVGVADESTLGAFLGEVNDVIVQRGGVAFVAPPSGPTALAYIGTVPTGPKLDGGFAEWTTVNRDSIGDELPTWDRDIDLATYAFKGNGSSSFFLASVVGTALNGTMIPQMNPSYVPPSIGNSTGTVSPPPPPVTGTDFVRFFLDADGNMSTGYRVGSIGADYLVEVIGKGGTILSSTGMRFAGNGSSDWRWLSVGPAPAAKDLSHIEVALPGVSISNLSRAFFQIDGWNGAQDQSAPLVIANPLDPFLVTVGGVVKWSPGTATWAALPSLPAAPSPGPQTAGWSDVVTTSGNDTYAIATDSTVYKLATGGSSWTLFISPPTPGGQKPATDVVAIATDSQNTYYAITQGAGGSPPKNNDIYTYTGTTAGSWGAPNTLAFTPVVDMEYIGGIAGTATLYLLQSGVNTQLMRSTNGAQTWTAFGTSLPATPGGSLANAGFTVFQSGISVLLNNGTIERSTNGASTWTWIPKSGSSPSGNGWADIAADLSGNLWVAAQLGSPSSYVAVWTYTLSTQTWGNMTGSLSVTSVAGLSASIPEFSDLGFPLIIGLSIPIFLRVYRRRPRLRGATGGP